MAIQLISNIKRPTKGILRFPDPRLRKVSKEIKTINTTTHKIANELFKILIFVDRPFIPNLGMAAPQIGYNVRIIAIKNSYRNYTLMINPEIIEQKWHLPSITMCFSLPGLYFRNQHYYFKVKYLDLEGKTHNRILKGGKATVFQQEIDHINGVLACD